MPKPKGWTRSMVKKRDKIAEAIMRKGMSKKSAYAIATWNVKRMKRRKKR